MQKNRDAQANPFTEFLVHSTWQLTALGEGGGIGGGLTISIAMWLNIEYIKPVPHGVFRGARLSGSGGQTA